MNAPTNAANLMPVEISPVTDSAALILHGDSMERIDRFATMMANGSATVPRHLAGKPADCFAVCLQAMQWRMNPFAVAQKSFISPDGKLGFEGTLVAAVLSTSGALEGDLRYEYCGDWSRVRGKFERKESTKTDRDTGAPKTYIVKTYTDKDEVGLSIKALGRLRGEKEDREVELFLNQCYPRFSTQWANNPEQQIAYAVNRVWARRHKPSVMLGVYTEDELGDSSEKFMGDVDVVPPPPPAASWPSDVFNLRLPEWRAAISAKRATADAIVAKARTKHPLTVEQEAAIRNVPKPDVTDAAPKFTYAQVAERITAATDADALAIARDIIPAVADEQQRNDLHQLADGRETELTAQE